MHLPIIPVTNTIEHHITVNVENPIRNSITLLAIKITPVINRYITNKTIYLYCYIYDTLLFYTIGIIWRQL